MNKIGFKNFRSLENTGMIDIKPINILVGKNNSGKSTFLRTFPLLRQSVESKIIGPLLWYGDYVDFGSFDESLYVNSQNNNISLLFDFEIIPRYLSSSRVLYISRSFTNQLARKSSEKISIQIEIDIGKGIKRNTLVDGFIIKFDDVDIKVKIKNNKIIRIVINDIDYSNLREKAIVDLRSQGFLPQPLESRESRELIYDKLILEIEKYIHPNTKKGTKHGIVGAINLGSSKSMLEGMKEISDIKTWKKNVAAWTIWSPEFIKIRDLFFLANLDRIISIVNEYLEKFSRNIRYLAPIRASAERYYRWQNLAVDEIDYRGQNIAMFLGNLTKTEIENYNKWTESILGVTFSTIESSGQLSIQVADKNSSFKRNLTDTGFGYSQILPIITQLWFLVNQRRSRIYRYRSQLSLNPSFPITFAFEQPELHLHPAMQARLADAFISTIREDESKRLDIRLIIETHSEAIVNRFGHLIYSGKVKPEDVNVLVFERNVEKNCTKVRTAKFDNKGYLSNWPVGFFQPEFEK